jgi:hypothetical protein
VHENSKRRQNNPPQQITPPNSIITQVTKESQETNISGRPNDPNFGEFLSLICVIT